MVSLIFLWQLSSFLFHSPPSEVLSLNAEEKQLYRLINQYRTERGLPEIPLSGALTKVAQYHVRDLQQNDGFTGRCNLHSWGRSDLWKNCCYTDDHKNAACMWDKPKEISGFEADGFEIAYHAGDMATAQDALKGWKGSVGHNQVIINQGSWKSMPWKAMGVGVNGHFAVVWFATEKDLTGISVDMEGL